MAMAALPLVLDPALGLRLHELLLEAVRSGESAGLKAIMDDGAVHTLVLALQLSVPPAASLVQAISGPDSLAQWLDLSCI